MGTSPRESVPLSSIVASQGTNECAFDADSVDCCVCMLPICPPVYQCTEGHLYCHQCLSVLEERQPEQRLCGVCRKELPPRATRIRNRLAEAFSATLQHACPYSSLGCPIARCIGEMAAHRELCLFNPFRCGCPEVSCMWEGRGDALEEHFASEKHTKVSKRIASGSLNSPIKQALHWPRSKPADFVIKVDGKLILRGITVEKQRYVFEVSTLCYVTEEARTSKLQYELQFGSSEDVIIFKAKVPMKDKGKHCVYVYFDQVRHIARPAEDVLPPAHKRNSGHLTAQMKTEMLLDFSHKFQLCP